QAWTQFTVKMPGQTLSDSNTAVNFSLAQEKGNVWLDGVSLVRTTSPIYWGAYINGPTYNIDGTTCYRTAPDPSTSGCSMSSWDKFETGASSKVSILHYQQN